MTRCFIIQPFDAGRFDKRYRDVFAPAVREAGLDPYRVDRDPSASIPIEEIENKINDSSVCLADITTDNPNVWFEVGFALAQKKEICLICSTERTSGFPFDVQHRLILKYSVESQSDFEQLKKLIVERLRAIMDKSKRLTRVSARSPLKEPQGMTQHEKVALCTILENRRVQNGLVSIFQIRDDMDRLGYNRLAVNLGIERRGLSTGCGYLLSSPQRYD